MCELIVACYALETAEAALSTRRLRRRCERILREAVDVEIDFQVDRTLARLQHMGIHPPRWRTLATAAAGTVGLIADRACVRRAWLRSGMIRSAFPNRLLNLR